MKTPNFHVVLNDGSTVLPCGWAAEDRGFVGHFHDFETVTQRFLGAKEYGEPSGFHTGGKPGTRGTRFYPIEEMCCIERSTA